MRVKKLFTELSFKINRSGYNQYIQMLNSLDKQAQKLAKNIAKSASGFKFDASKIKNVGKEFEGAAKGAEKLGAKVAGLNQKASSFGVKFKDAFKANFPLGKLDSVNSKLSKGTSLAGQFKGAVVGLVAALGAISVAKGIFNTNVELIKMKAALKTATGGIDQADAAFKKIQNFAATTPFDLQQSVEGFIKLKNLGLTPSERALRSYGNTATAMGKSMTQMIEAVADASTFEFERLKEFGIKAKQQGDQVEFTFRGVKTKVKKDAKDIEEYLMKLGEVNFATAMADQMNTLPGIISNLKDNFTQFQIAIGEGGLNNALADLLSIFRDLMGDSINLGTAIGKGLAVPIGGLANIIRTTMAFVKDFIQAFKEVDKTGASLGTNNSKSFLLIKSAVSTTVSVVRQLSETFRKLNSDFKIVETAGYAVATVFTILTSRAIGMMALNIAGWLNGAVTAMRSFSVAAGLAQASAFAIPIAIGVVIGSIGLLVADFFKLRSTGESIFDTLGKKFPTLAPIFQRLAQVSRTLQPIFEKVFQAIKTGVDKAKGVLDEFKPFFSTVFEPIKKIALEVGKTLLSLGKDFLALGKTALSAIVPLLGPLGNVVKAILKIGLLVVAGALKFVQWGVQVVGVVVRVASQIITSMARFFIFLAGKIAYGIAKFLEFGARVVEALIRAFTQPRQALNDFIALVSSTASRFKDLLVKAVDIVVKSFQTGFSTIKSLINGVSGDASGLAGKLGNLSGQLNNIQSQQKKINSTGLKTSALSSPPGGNVSSSSSLFNNRNNFQLSASITQEIILQNSGNNVSGRNLQEIGSNSEDAVLKAFGQLGRLIPVVTAGTGAEVT